MKIHPVGAELFHAGRRTGMTKLTVAFRNFANARTNAKIQICPCAHHKRIYKAQGYSSILSYPQHHQLLCRIWNPPNLLFNGYLG